MCGLFTAALLTVALFTVGLFAGIIVNSPLQKVGLAGFVRRTGNTLFH
jgi:hypothetical protein